MRGGLEVASRPRRERAKCKVHVAHEVLGRHVVFALVAERARDHVLILERQAIALERDERVQSEAHAQEQVLRERDLAVERAAGHEAEPADELRVAEPADAVLQVGFEHEHGVAQTLGAALAIGLHELEEPHQAGAREVLVDGAAHRLGGRRIAGEVARGERCGRERRLLAREQQRLGDGAHPVAELEAPARELVEEDLHQRLGVGRAIGDDHLDIDVRAQAHLATAVAAERHQRPAIGQPHAAWRRRHGLCQRAPECFQHDRVDLPGEALAQKIPGRVGQVLDDLRLVGCDEAGHARLSRTRDLSR